LPVLGLILKSVEVRCEIIRSHGNGFLLCKVVLWKRRRLGAFSATLVRVLRFLVSSCSSFSLGRLAMMRPLEMVCPCTSLLSPTEPAPTGPVVGPCKPVTCTLLVCCRFFLGLVFPFIYSSFGWDLSCGSEMSS
jgi:hypothetical protein